MTVLRSSRSPLLLPLAALTALLPLAASLAPATALAQTPTSTEEEVDQAAKPGTTEINLKNAEIAAIIRIFSKKTGRNYILDENVKGKVTIYLPGRVSSNEAVRILDSILALKGFTSVPVSENLWKIIPAKDAKQATIPLKTAKDPTLDKPSAAVVTRIVPLKFVSADDMKQLISPLVSPEGLLNAYTGTNSLIIIDSEDNIQRVVSIIGDLDVPSSDRDMTIIPVTNADATDIAAKLNEILGSPGSGSSAGANPNADTSDLLRGRVEQTNRAPGQPGVQPVSLGSKTVTARTKEPKITADERTNSVIVVADEETTARIRALIAQLDSKVDLSGNKFYVYRCQHASAQELADVLSGLGSGGGTSGASGRNSAFGSNSSSRNSGDDAFGSSNRNSSNNRSSGSSRNSSSFNRLSNQSRTPGHSRNEGKNKGTPGAVSLGENISITADPATNSLIIFSSKQDYERVLALLKDLDIKRRQVLVEAILLEVGIDDSNALGLSFLTSTGGADGGGLIKNGDIINSLANPGGIQNFAIAAASAGTLTLPNGTKVPTQAALITAVQNNQNVNVLSAPSILTTDNEEAEIVVGQNVPFLASTSSNETNLNNTFNQIDRQDVGITLRLTPQISSGEFVTLKIFTEVSNVLGDTANSSLGPTTTIRTSDTTVITKDSQMVVTGGLMADGISDTEGGVPYLMDIPVLGHLFKQTGQSHRKTNLLIFITPKIIKDQFDHREITIAQRNDLESEMARLKSYPDRSEVLRDERIDKVSEAQPWEGPKPGTILPPLKEAGSDHKITLEGAPQSQGDVIELKVAPKLPAGSSAPKSPPAPKMSDSPPGPEAPAAAIQPGSASEQIPQAKAGAGARFVILEAKKGVKLPANVPFSDSAKGGLVAVAIGPDNPAAARDFFEAGQQYRYEIDGHDLVFTAVGVYSDTETARKLHKRLPTQWYTLSPYEIMNLGSGPWRPVQ